MSTPSSGTPLPAELQGKIHDANTESLSRLEEALYTLIAGSAERSRIAVDTVQKASTAVLAIYTGLLALVFSASGTPLPLRGVVAAVFLGLAVVLSTVYLAFIGTGRSETLTVSLPDGQEGRAFAQLAFFARYVSAIVNRRVRWLRASVVALGIGLVAISFPFLSSTALSLTQATEAGSAEGSGMIWPTQVPADLPGEAAAVLLQAQIERALEEHEAGSAPQDGVIEKVEFVVWSTAVGVAAVAAAGVLPVRRKALAAGQGVPVVDLET